MLKNIFSVSSIIEKLSELIKRFPLSVLLVISLAITFFVEVDDYHVPFYLWAFFSISIPFSVAIVLFCEDFLSNLKTQSISFLAILLCSVYSSFLPESFGTIFDHNISMGKAIEVLVFYFTAFFSIFFISFFKKNKDSAFWNFTSQTVYQMILACFFGAVFYAGLSLALLAVENLFGISIGSKIYSHLAIVCFALFSQIYFLANIPSKTEKHNSQIFYAKVQKIFSLYVLTPILATYTVILYAYLLKIIFTWELPKGYVSWLVTVLACGGLFVISLFYPLNKKQDSKIAAFISRWFGLLILPLLMLMSIALFRRIDDYGITINRCYMLLLNMWFYGIYIYLFVTRSQSIKWILISFVGIAVLSSVNIWGVSNFTQNYLTREIKAIFNKPVSIANAKAIISEKAQEEQDRIKSTLEYLSSTFGKESIQVFFTADTSIEATLEKIDAIENIFKEEKEYMNYHAEEKIWNIRKYQDYNNFTEINYNNYKRVKSDDERNEGEEQFSKKDTIEVSVSERNFYIPIRETVLTYLATDKEEGKMQNFVITGENYALLVKSFYGIYYPEKDSIHINSLNGFLFYE